MANGVAMSKPAAVKKTARRKPSSPSPRKERILTPECFDKEFWEELRAGLEAHGISPTEYLQTLTEVRRELRDMSKSELDAKYESIMAELREYREQIKAADFLREVL